MSSRPRAASARNVETVSRARGKSSQASRKGPTALSLSRIARCSDPNKLPQPFVRGERSMPLFERLFCDFEIELYGEATVPKQCKVKVPISPGLGLDPMPEVLQPFRV